MNNDIHDYSDIYLMKHPEPKHHKRMSLENRAAQFAPFSALVGYEESIQEEGRKVEPKKILSSEEIEHISNTLTLLKNKIKEQPLVEIEYFIKDEKKDGGHYQIKKDKLFKIDEYEHKIIFKDKTNIFFDDIYKIKEI